MLCVQERDGLFMLAFAHPGDAVTWAVLLQLALLRYLMFASLLGATVSSSSKSARRMTLEPESFLISAWRLCLEDRSGVCGSMLPQVADDGRYHAGPHCS